jgi:hypothetical protein
MYLPDANNGTLGSQREAEIIGGEEAVNYTHVGY